VLLSSLRVGLLLMVTTEIANLQFSGEIKIGGHNWKGSWLAELPERPFQLK